MPPLTYEGLRPGSVTAIFVPGETADRSKGASLAIAGGVVADVDRSICHRVIERHR